MKEYVERKYLEDIVSCYLFHSNGAEHYAYSIMRGEVKTAPAANVVEIRHGHWKKVCDKTFIDAADALYFPIEYECSICGHHDDRHRPFKAPYCWYCGAKMDEAK